MTRRNLSIALLLAVLIGLPLVALRFSQSAAYDTQSLTYGLWRLNAILVWVISSLRLSSMIQQDDLEEDYKRINNGNLAVAVYRGFEYFGFIFAATMLIGKI